MIIPPDVNVWPHELKTAKALAGAGYVVEFVRRRETEHEKTADALIDGEMWEFKAPKSGKLKAVERNLKRGRRQSENIVFDGRRMKGVPDEAIEREVRSQAFKVSNIRRLIYVTRYGKVIDIK